MPCHAKPFRPGRRPGEGKRKFKKAKKIAQERAKFIFAAIAVAGAKC